MPETDGSGSSSVGRSRGRGLLNEFAVSSRLSAEAEVVWRHAVSPSGVNRELRPILRMTFPRGVADLTSAWRPGQRLFRSWLLVGGLLPIEYDDVVFEEVEPGRRFLERSTLLTQRLWEHERTIEPASPGCCITDRVRFVPRLGWLAAPYRLVFRAVFRWRHRNLRRLFGEPAVRIGLARAEDLPLLPHIEREAASRFADRQVPHAVLEETTPPSELAAAQRAGRLWVARARGEGVVGFALVGLVGGEPHLHEMDVLPSHGRRGIGRALVDAVKRGALADGHTSLTLTTFRDVPWNAPFYARLGFRELERDALPPSLQALVRAEAERGLDPSRRVAMACTLGST